MKRTLIVMLFALAAAPMAAQPLSEKAQIIAAVSPLPEEYRDGAEVRIWSDDGLKTVRPGTNQMICLADQPGDDRFHAACYHASLEPFMKRGRELRDRGIERDEVQRIREEEVAAGRLKVPDQAASLYSLTGPPDSFDPATGEVEGASPLYVVYMPYATTESTGLPARAPRGQPWLMNPGKPWAHIMLSPPETGTSEEEN